ncbi:metallophosphoesterase [Alkalicella caledoniensis]|uniref:Metallophosphoesterase n=1 Tax=Alkalicella caledoniensis TaxID=2731377 RepID=A0A7G9W4Z0_ALKCA|nr:metallophosphoesterase [Alkalicella caledoniensis]QNO13752.1 metallophosphoesterase [Alkalicella caledoniensis]
MRPYFYFVYTTATILYGLVCYYIGTRILRVLSQWIPNLNLFVYWFLFGSIAASYVISRFFKAYIPLSLTKIITNIGAYWLGILFYLIFMFVILDIISRLLEVTNIANGSLTHNPLYLNATGVLIFFTLFVVLIYGTHIARNPVIVEYDIHIPKGAKLENLNAVLITDVHLGKIIDNKRLMKMVDMVYDIDPDIIFFAGDIVDEDIRPYVSEQMYKSFGRLKPKYGMYASLGNHEYVGGHVEEITHYLEKSGITVLIDEHVLVEESFYVAGRNDPTGARISGVPRKSLDEWLVDIDKDLPLIMMDHQPKSINEAERGGVDLLLSGHTHRGQIFPNAIVTNFIFENHWGLSEKGDMKVIVSSGFGTWGPPIRLGTRGEIVKINISFN